MKRANKNDWGERTKLENEKRKSENGERDRGREKFRMEGRLRDAGREEEMRK